jgi:hypothetical protein
VVLIDFPFFLKDRLSWASQSGFFSSDSPQVYMITPCFRKSFFAQKQGGFAKVLCCFTGAAIHDRIAQKSFLVNLASKLLSWKKVGASAACFSFVEKMMMIYVSLHAKRSRNE